MKNFDFDHTLYEVWADDRDGFNLRWPCVALDQARRAVEEFNKEEAENARLERRAVNRTFFVVEVGITRTPLTK